MAMTMRSSIVAALVAVLLVASANAQSPPPADCTSAYGSVVPCLSYVSGPDPSPSAACCAGLATLNAQNPVCLCQVISQLNTTYAAANATKALSLPATCNVAVNTKNCPALANIPGAPPPQTATPPPTPSAPSPPPSTSTPPPSSGAPPPSAGAPPPPSSFSPAHAPGPMAGGPGSSPPVAGGPNSSPGGPVAGGPGSSPGGVGPGSETPGPAPQGHSAASTSRPVSWTVVLAVALVGAEAVLWMF